MFRHPVSITAEFVALMKADELSDYLHFVSLKTKILYWVFCVFLSRKRMHSIFENRLRLSKEFDTFLLKGKYDCIVDLGCGYSLRGFLESLNNKHCTFVDVDFSEVVLFKRKIVEQICVNKGVAFPANYFLVSCDVLKDDLFFKLKKYTQGKTLFLAEGLTPYFTDLEYSSFLETLQLFFEGGNAVFFSQERLLRKSSFLYSFVRGFVSLITFRKSHVRFSLKRELTESLKKKGFGRVFSYVKDGFLFYRIG